MLQGTRGQRLGDSPYMPYLKWLRLRAAIDRVYGTVQEGGNTGRREMARLRQLSEDLLREFHGTAIPIERDALIVKGVIQAAQVEMLEKFQKDGAAGMREMTGNEETGGALPLLRQALPHMGVKGGLEELKKRDVAALAARERKAVEQTLKELKERFAPTRGVRQLEDWLR